jgi:tetratricopeptide (TPR) repeat protein
MDQHDQEPLQIRRGGSLAERRRLLVSLLIVAATVGAFAQVIQHQFVHLDDHIYVLDNPQVRRGLAPESIRWALTATTATNWHPLTWLSHMLDVTLFGVSPGAHHLVNLLFHTANALLLFLLLCRSTGATWRSGLVAALFALHPLHVESVAWISERKDVLSGLFWWLTMLSYLSYANRPTLPRYLPVLLLFALGLLAKPMLVTLPFVLLLFDLWPLERWGRDRARLRYLLLEKVPLLLLATVSCIVTLHVQQDALASPEGSSLTLRITNAVTSYAVYLGKTLWPAHLAAFYPHPVSIPVWQWLGASVLLVALSLLALRSVSTRPYFAVGWCWFLGTLVPVIGLVQVGRQALADRYTYIPLVGIFVIIAWGAEEFVRRYRLSLRLVAFVFALIFTVLTWLTWQQVRTWHDSITLFEHALHLTRDNYVAHVNLGRALAEEGRPAEAEQHLREALRIYPGYDEARVNLGVLLAKDGRFEEAAPHLRSVLQATPDHVGALLNLGTILERQGLVAEASSYYAAALRVAPDNARAHFSQGHALMLLGRTAEASRHFEEALRIDPGYAKAHVNLGALSSRRGDMDQAIRHFQAVIAIDNNDASAHYNLGVLLASQGNFTDAIDHYRLALGARPTLVQAHNALAAALIQVGSLDEAIVHLEEAIRLRPDFAEARRNLDRARALRGSRGP